MADWGAVGSGAASGASTGASFGPWGAAIGGVLGAAGGLLGGKKKAKPVYSSLGVKSSGEAFLDALNANRTANAGDLSNYSAAIAAANPVAAALAEHQSKILGGLIDRSPAYDPNANTLDLLHGYTSNLTGLIPSILGSTRRERGLRLAGLGITSPTSTYNDRADLSQLGASLGPILNTIYGGIGMDSSRNEAARAANIAQTVGLMGTQANLPYDAAARMLLPTTARNAALTSGITELGGIGDILNRNIAGWNVSASPWAGAMTGAMTGAAQGASLAKSLHLQPVTNGAAPAGGGMTISELVNLIRGGTGGADAAARPNYSSPVYDFGSPGASGVYDWSKLLS